MLHWKAGHVHILIAILFALTGTFGTFAGATVAALVPVQVILVSLALVMIIVSTLMLRSSRDQNEQEQVKLNLNNLLSVVPASLGVGFLTGFLGIGGGFLIVPALTLVARLPVKHAIGTSLVVIALNCLSGFIAHESTEFSLEILLSFLAASISVSVFAARYAKKAKSNNLKKYFALFVLVIGVIIGIDSFSR